MLAHSPNYMEVGGPDTAVLSAVGNTAANLTGLTVPTIGAYFKSSTGSYTGLFLMTAANNLVAMLAFLRWGGSRPAREVLYEQRALKAAADKTNRA